mgnify:CR=1 FL=1
MKIPKGSSVSKELSKKFGRVFNTKDFEKQRELERKALFLKEKKRMKAWKIHNLKHHTA